MPTLDDLLATAPVLADGAMGTMLQARGHRLDDCLEGLNLTHPDDVRAIHAAYVAAGARLVSTNSFGASRVRLRRHGLEDQIGAINAAAVELARRAAGDRALVCGDVGPLGARMAPYGRLQASQAFDTFAEQIGLLASAGCDLIVLETFADLRELLEAIRAARSVCGLPIIATMTFTRDDRTLLGETAAQVAAKVAAVLAPPEVVGVNCAGGPAQTLRLLREMGAAAPALRLAARPNAGWPEQVGGRVAYPATAEYFGRAAVALAAEGVAIIGGCCGTTPAHVAAIRDALGGRPTVAVQQVRVGSRASEPARAAAEPAAPAERSPSPLAAKLEAGAFVITVEMTPPKGHAAEPMLAGAQFLKEAGADAINVADSPMARMRMAPWAACHLIRREVGIDTVLHFPLRGRNLLRVQSDLLAAHALGIRNLFAVMGDPTAIGDHPGASDSYDLVPSGLIRLVKESLNAGVDQAGGDIGRPTSFFIGCALNLAAADRAKEIRALRQKLSAGADFILCQPIFEAGVAGEFLLHYQRQHGALDVPLIAGVLPLYGSRHARFLDNEVPGIDIPEAIHRRIAAGGRDEGVRIAAEIAATLRPLVRGIYLMPPFGKYDMAGEVIERVLSSRS